MEKSLEVAPGGRGKTDPEATSHASVQRLSRAITFRTIAGYPEPDDRGAFSGFLDFIEEAFPRLFAAARVTREDPWRLVLALDGTDPSLLPVLLLGHFDVVNVATETAQDWTHAPFSGDIADGYVWGRGAIDDKSSVMAILEAAELAVAGGETPTRGLVVAFGGDEELSGTNGAQATASQLRREGRRFHFILEEASVIVDGVLDAVTAPLALIGLTEKGVVDVTVTAESEGGHAGRPPRNTAIGVLSRAITRIEDHPFPVRRIRSVDAFFRVTGRSAVGLAGFAYRHPRLMWPLMSRLLVGKPSTNALVRTTQAVTVVQGGTAPNVLPQQAACVINVRILPGDTVDSVLRHYQKLLGDLPVKVEAGTKVAHDPAPETSADHEGFDAIRATLADVAPEVSPVPFIVTDSTDSKYYAGLSDATLRFVPVTLVAEDLPRVHGTNERVGAEDYLRMIAFYSRLFERVCWHD